MIKKIILLTCILFAGCATTPQQVVTSEQVKVPVAVTCQVQYPQQPENLLSKLKPTDSVLIKGNTVIAELKLYKDYSAALFAALSKCATDTSANDAQK
jgi:hypothetical protein